MDKETPGLGTYLYCVTNHIGEERSLSFPGVDGQLIHSISAKDISGIVHRCTAVPYDTKNDEVARGWVMSHQNIVDLAMHNYETVVPLKFNTIFKGGDDEVISWLNQEQDRLKFLLNMFKNKAEYSIKISIDDDILGKLVNKHSEVSELKEALESKPKGASYLMQKKVEQVTRVFREVEIRAISEEILQKIKVLSEEIHRENTPLEEKNQMILKISCLVKTENVKPLGKILSTFIENDGLAVKFTGPWPPYSFVNCENIKGI